VALWAFNESHPGGVSAIVTVHVWSSGCITLRLTVLIATALHLLGHRGYEHPGRGERRTARGDRAGDQRHLRHRGRAVHGR